MCGYINGPQRAISKPTRPGRLSWRNAQTSRLRQCEVSNSEASFYERLYRPGKAIKEIGKPIEGQEAVLTCQGPSGYRIVVGYSAFSAGLHAERGDESVSLGKFEGSYVEQGRKVEWRLADGKQFAVLLRQNYYKPTDGDVNPDGKKYFLKTVVSIVGLTGFERVSGEVPAKSAQANANARALADARFAAK